MKTCKRCGCEYDPYHHNQKYCKKCQAQAYNEARRNARNRYNQNHPRKRFKLVLCAWCAKPFVSSQNRKYCSMKCRREARREQNNRHQKKYRSIHGKSDKERYYSNLGTSNLREHRNDCFDDERRLISAERRRLHI